MLHVNNIAGEVKHDDMEMVAHELGVALEIAEVLMREECPVEVVQRVGGWFVDIEGDSSGPWKTQKAATLASEGKYNEAHFEHNNAIRESLK